MVLYVEMRFQATSFNFSIIPPNVTSSETTDKRAKLLLKTKMDKSSGMGIYYPCSTVLPDVRVHKPFRDELPDAPAIAHALHFPPMGVFLWMLSF